MKSDAAERAEAAAERQERRRPWLLAALGLALAMFVLRALHGLLSEVRYADIVAEVAAVSGGKLWCALGATVLSYLALAGYDRSALRYAGAKVRGGTVLLTSFIAFAFSNTIGLGVLTGGAVRLRLYTAAGIDAAQVTQAIAFNAVAFGVGMAAFGGVGLWWGAAGLAAAAGVPVMLLQAIAAAAVIAIAAFVALCQWPGRAGIAARWQLHLPTAGLVLGQLAISAVDLSTAAAALWFLLPAGAVSLPDFVAFYAVGVALGVLSHVPGGLGVFEAVILFACAGRVPAEQVAGALVVYRAVYYLLPLLLAALLLAGYELRAAVATPVAHAAARLLPATLAAILVIAGIMLLISGVTPVDDDAMEVLAATVPLPLVEAAHLFASLVGLAMLFVARGLFHRLDGAWWAAVALNLLGGVLALPKGVAVSEALSLGALALLLISSRRQFARRSNLFEQRFEPGWWLCVGTVLAVSLSVLLFAYQDVGYAQALWWQFEFDADGPRSLRAMMAVAVLALALALGQLFRVARGAAGPVAAADLERAHAVLERQTSADAYVAMMGDKSFMFADSGTAFIMYGQHGRSWVALFDPVGPQEEWPELVWRFIELAHEHGGRAAFYQVRPQALPMYLDAGLRLFKLGEEAHVPLANFDIKGARRANLRHGVNRAEREGLSFEVIARSAVADHLPALQAVSQAWMDAQDTREKAFSLGAFVPTYLCRQPVAVVRRDGAIIAFASLFLPLLTDEVSLDLMRHLPEAPNGTMDYLFVKLMAHCRAAGYQRFGLGMAPMSGMVAHPLAARWQRFGRLVFEHGERFYNFRGLRSFKDKFDPVWEARYLAAPGGLAPLLALTDTAALIGGGYRGIIAK